MYIRPVHAELDLRTLHQFIRQYPLGLFTTAIPHPTHATLQTTHIPFVLDCPTNYDTDSSRGVLRGHMARANPQCKAMIDSLVESGADELKDEVLVLFNAPVHSYVTPKFYVETKPAEGKVVPTWDYAAVQVYGRAKVYHLNNEATSAFLQRQIEDLTNQEEGAMVEAARKRGKVEGEQWEVDDAPKRYIDLLKKAIIGLEIRIERIEGRFKLSQESSDGDWKGVVDGFKSLGTQEGEKMAQMVQERGAHRMAKAGENDENAGSRP